MLLHIYIILRYTITLCRLKQRQALFSSFLSQMEIALVVITGYTSSRAPGHYNRQDIVTHTGNTRAHNVHTYYYKQSAHIIAFRLHKERKKRVEENEGRKEGNVLFNTFYIMASEIW